ncbi:hypothetical protein [Cedecea sp. FDAARGOS_727]|uniref:hypothetical protein n=1 Tax=Cedecea sp. FDAARGOS_727 TaxID=2545798 RepID=UPI00143EF072|nr:hypothetical protein [Cedecea sp. FDAARGOS_727]QIX97445.1 hypothetical protein FOC35_17910 [Cedecea sp. FDAARGOS_727]
MSDLDHVDYLVLGGERHGEVWNGLPMKQWLQLPRTQQPMAKFYSRDQQAEITVPLNDCYFITEYNYLGERFLVASTEPLAKFDVDKEIKNLLPGGISPIK